MSATDTTTTEDYDDSDTTEDYDDWANWEDEKQLLRATQRARAPEAADYPTPHAFVAHTYRRQDKVCLPTLLLFAAALVFLVVVLLLLRVLLARQ